MITINIKSFYLIHVLGQPRNVIAGVPMLVAYVCFAGAATEKTISSWEQGIPTPLPAERYCGRRN